MTALNKPTNVERYIRFQRKHVALAKWAVDKVYNEQKPEGFQYLYFDACDFALIFGYYLAVDDPVDFL